MAKFDPLPETPEWTDWKNIWHDWLPHRPKQSSKIWFRRNFPGRRYTYPTYKGSSFFLFIYFYFFNFLRSLMRVQPKTAEPILTRNTSFDAVWWESDPFSEMKNINRWPWPRKGQNPPFCLTLKILTRIFSKTVRDRKNVSMEVR